MKLILILGGFGAAVGAAIATLGLNVWLGFSVSSSLPTSFLQSFLNLLTFVPLTGAMIGIVTAWLALRWRKLGWVRG